MKFNKEYALTKATLIDGNGRSPVKNAVVVVKDGIIEKVGGEETISSEDSIQKLDLSGYYLMPGLIDVHVHIVGVGSRRLLDNILEPNYLQAMRVVAEAEKLIDHGFTTVRSGGSRYDIYLKRAIEEGTVVGPRVMACGLGLCRTRGHGDSVRRDLYDLPEAWVGDNLPKAQLVDGVEEIRKAIRKLVGQNVDHVKFWATGGGSWEKERTVDMHFSMDEMKTVLDEANKVGLPVMCHAESIESVKAAVELGVRSIEHGDDDGGYELDEKTCMTMVEKNIFLTPTLSIFCLENGSEKDLPKSWITNLKRALKCGVKFLLGTDAWMNSVTPYGTYNAGEMKLLVDILDMTPLEAITSATKFGAEVCGIGDQIGTIEKGKIADLVIVKKDPSANIEVLLDKENFKYVIKEGNLVAEH